MVGGAACSAFGGLGRRARKRTNKPRANTDKVFCQLLGFGTGSVPRAVSAVRSRARGSRIIIVKIRALRRRFFVLPACMSAMRRSQAGKPDRAKRPTAAIRPSQKLAGSVGIWVTSTGMGVGVTSTGMGSMGHMMPWCTSAVGLGEGAAEALLEPRVLEMVCDMSRPASAGMAGTCR